MLRIRLCLSLLNLLAMAILVGLPFASVSSVAAIEMKKNHAVSKNLEEKSEVLLRVQGLLSEDDKQLSDGSYHDVYMFYGQTSDIVRITLASKDFDSFLLLLNSAGTEIARNDDSLESTDSEIVFRLPATGQYQVVVNALSEEEQGSYLLTVSESNAKALRLMDLKVEADRLFQQGIEADRLGQTQEALEFWRAAASAHREAGFRKGEASSLGNMANAYDSLGEYQQAIDYYEQQLKIAREIDDRLGESNALGNAGNTYSSIGNYTRAIELQTQSLIIRREIGFREGEANSLASLSDSHSSLGEYQQAIDYYEQQLKLVREMGDRLSESNILGDMGIAYSDLGKYKQAISYYEQQLSVTKDIGDRLGESYAIGNMGNAYDAIGSYGRAIDYYEQQLSIAREIGNRLSESNALGNAGNTYDSIGNYERAIDLQTQALTIRREIGFRQGEANSLGDLGNAYDHLGEYEQAIDYYEQQLSIAKEIGNRLSESNALGNAGNTYDSIGNYERAIDLQTQALTIRREIGFRQGEVNSLGDLGNIYNNIGEYEQAIDYYEQQLPISEEIGYRRGTANALRNLGGLYLTQGNIALAENVLFNAISIHEDLRSTDLSDSDRISFFEIQADMYTNLEEVLVLQNKVEKALEVAERGRNRSFIQLLSKNLSLDSLDREIAQIPSFGEMQKIAKEQQATLVEYSFSNNSFGGGSSLYIWLVQPSGELYFKSVPLHGRLSELTNLVEQSRMAMDVHGRGGLELKHQSGGDATDELRELYQLLVKPIEQWLPTNPDQRVVFVPKGELFLVPFPALQNEDGIYLIEQHTVSTAPSIQLLDLTERQAIAANKLKAATEILTVGNPTMPEVWNSESVALTQLPALVGSEREAKAVASFFDTQALVGRQATEQIVKQKIENARIVHLATHGLLEYGKPEESGMRDVPGAIALAPSQGEDGLLTAAEILDLNLRADLVVLSACDTGLGSITGDGVIGLSRSFIAAGTPSVVVSLWSVDDDSTTDLMIEFYRQMQKGNDKAQALRQAMLITMETYSNPRDWAAFTLIGEAD